MSITKINIEDYQILENIGKDSLPIYYHKRDIIYMDVFDKNNIMLKYSINNKIIGFIFCSYQSDNIHINSFAISKKYRRKGYGQNMIEYIKKYKKNITLNVLETNENAIQFYKKTATEI